MTNENHAISFSRETLSTELLDELQPIFDEHYLEIAHYQDIPLKPVFQSYFDTQAQNRLRLFVVRNHGVAIGYNIVVVQQNAHYGTSKQAAQDILYVTKEYRGEGIGRRLVVYANEMLAVEQTQLIHHHVKVAHPALAHILETEGFELVEYVYSKRLDKPSLYPSAAEHMANIKAWEAAQ
jgi:GNAT superfamily N-acetyltransferase